MPSSLLEWALFYVEQGRPVFPVHYPTPGGCSCRDLTCEAAGKHPATSRGFKDATLDPRQVREWWETGPQCNIATPVGEKEVVLDVDPRNGGVEAFVALMEEGGPPPPGPHARTGGGGDHFWFAVARPVSPAHGFRPGLDLQGSGSYVVLPPSLHRSGARYSWIQPLGALAPAPPWLLEAAGRAEAPPGGPGRVGGPSREFALDSKRKIPHGQHHDFIVSTAAALARRIHGLEQEEGVAMLRAALGQALDDVDTHEAEIREAVRSAIGKFRPPGPSPAPQTPREEPSAQAEGPTTPPGPLDPLRAAVARVTRCLAHPNANTAGGFVPLLLVDLLVDEYGDGLRYDVDAGKFRSYDEGIWPEDHTGIEVRHGEELLEHLDSWCRNLLNAPETVTWMAELMARHTEAVIEAQRRGEPPPELRDIPAPPSPVPWMDDRTWKKVVFGAEDLLIFRVKRSRRREISDATYLLTTRNGIGVQSHDLNPDPWTLPVRTGLLNLRTGEVRPFSRSEIWTWKSPYAPDPAKPTPKWTAFLELFAPDLTVRGYLQRLAFYILTGDTGEQAVFDLWGPGSNGKTTFCQVLEGLNPGATVRADPATFGDKASDRIPNDLARMRGARLILVPETPRGMRLHEDLMHRFSGGDTISARFLHREYFDYVPTGKLLFYGSEKLRIVGQSPATWRRMKFIKAVTKFAAPGEPKNIKDYHLTLLSEEGDGILAWAMAAREDFLAHGLSTPATITQDTTDFREESDWLMAFLSDCVEKKDGGTIAAKTMRDALVGWAMDNDEPTVTKISARRLSAELEERGYKKATHHGVARAWEDVALTAAGLLCVQRQASVQRSIDEEGPSGDGTHWPSRSRSRGN